MSSSNGLVRGADIGSQMWDDFITSSPEGIVYATYDYISIAAPGWQAVVLSSGNEIQAVFPFYVKKKMGISYFYQPFFTQSWGVFFKPMHCKISKEYDLKKKLIKQILEFITPCFSEADFNCTPHFDYPLPFHWEGYTIKNKYTYQVDTAIALSDIWSETAEGIRRDIKKAKKASILIERTDTADDVITLFQERKANEIRDIEHQDFSKLKQIFDTLHKAGNAHVLEAKDSEGQLIAGILLYEYKELTTYFFGTSTLEAKTSGAMSLLLWHAIEAAAAGGYLRFDFEGSMIESIERYFRGFGARPVPYLNLTKTSKLIQLKKMVQD